MDRVLIVIFFVIGWVSGGGTLAFACMFIIEPMLGTDYNTSFVGGCLWGTFGVISGRFMMNHARENFLKERTP